MFSVVRPKVCKYLGWTVFAISHGRRNRYGIYCFNYWIIVSLVGCVIVIWTKFTLYEIKCLVFRMPNFTNITSSKENGDQKELFRSFWQNVWVFLLLNSSCLTRGLSLLVHRHGDGHGGEPKWRNTWVGVNTQIYGPVAYGGMAATQQLGARAFVRLRVTVSFVNSALAQEMFVVLNTNYFIPGYVLLFNLN